MKQPAVARLEAGESNPSWETLQRISRALGVEFLVDISPTKRRSLVGKELDRAEVVERLSSGGTEIVVAAT